MGDASGSNCRGCQRATVVEGSGQGHGISRPAYRRTDNCGPLALLWRGAALRRCAAQNPGIGRISMHGSLVSGGRPGRTLCIWGSAWGVPSRGFGTNHGRGVTAGPCTIRTRTSLAVPHESRQDSPRSSKRACSTKRVHSDILHEVLMRSPLQRRMVHRPPVWPVASLLRWPDRCRNVQLVFRAAEQTPRRP